MNATVLAVFPSVLDLEPPELAPSLDTGSSDELSGYVAHHLLEGRRPFDVLADPYVAERVDDYLSVLDHLARDPAFRLALETGSDPAHRHSLPA